MIDRCRTRHFAPTCLSRSRCLPRTLSDFPEKIKCALSVASRIVLNLSGNRVFVTGLCTLGLGRICACASRRIERPCANWGPLARKRRSRERSGCRQALRLYIGVGMSDGRLLINEYRDVLRLGVAERRSCGSQLLVDYLRHREMKAYRSADWRFSSYCQGAFRRSGTPSDVESPLGMVQPFKPACGPLSTWT